MPMHVCNTATLMCSFGVAPSTMIVLPQNKVMTSNMPAANIMDNSPSPISRRLACASRRAIRR